MFSSVGLRKFDVFRAPKNPGLIQRSALDVKTCANCAFARFDAVVWVHAAVQYHSFKKREKERDC